MSKFLKGTLILLFTGLITRVLGFINRILIARFIGEEGVGLYMMAYPTFILVVTLTQIGLPVAISKRVAEAEALGDTAKVKKILVVSLMTTLTLSIIFTPLLFFGAPLLAGTIFTDERIIYPIIAIAPVIPIVAVSSVIRGYFQGKQNMKPSAFSQLIEQLIRIAFIAILTRIALPYGIEYAAAAVMIATIIGELVSFIYLVTMFKIRKAFPLRKNFFKSLTKTRSVFKDLMTIAIPTTGSRMIGSVSWFLEPIVVTQALAIAGVSAVMATKQYGALTGLAMPLLLLPSFVTFALSTALVPAISEAVSVKNYASVEKRIQQAIKFCILTGALPVIILYILAEPLMSILYNSTSGVLFIKIIAPFILLSYLQSPLQAVLQALDLASSAMINSLIGAVVKLVIIFTLASNPNFGINGVAIGIIVGFMLVSLLHYATILKVIPLTFYLTFYLKIIGVTVLSGLLGKNLYTFFTEYVSISFAVFITALTMAVVYILLALLFKIVKLRDLQKITTLIFPPKGQV
ncbi:stage V sporulation protein B [Pallidibacillus pasinlerensis]|uniref:Stage V sporulation protein B n=1 Tax=Pallidibacillus pasinlerensis TaxID=2703818 RepID=A0ABX0A5A6_9BACI|nr:stage V sporulation protein B [Pallidibacillus pasinlerensis]NCU18631.1 stage V sporulation protein B [Pallidibacillus pasinlerensis]